MPYKIDSENKTTTYYTGDVSPENGILVQDSFNPAVIDYVGIAERAYERLVELYSRKNSLTLKDKKNYFVKIYNSFVANELEKIKEL